jgi:fumarate reductase flavoprotein subunit
MQVLDTKGKIIPGLYAAGNVTGDFFANDYPVICPGLSHGRALTFGRIAGLNAAAEKV